MDAAPQRNGISSGGGSTSGRIRVTAVNTAAIGTAQQRNSISSGAYSVPSRGRVTNENAAAIGTALLCNSVSFRHSFSAAIVLGEAWHDETKSIYIFQIQGIP